jgi:glycopeptide antibiotics resistance protein
MSKKTVLFILFFVTVAVFYYSWLPDPDLRNETYLPNWLLKWSNYYYNLRTEVPFVALGYLLETYSYKRSADETHLDKNLIFIKNMIIAAVVACIAEGGQFLIKRRSPDLMDVFFGILGSIVGCVGFHFVNKIMNYKKLSNAE